MSSFDLRSRSFVRVDPEMWFGCHRCCRLFPRLGRSFVHSLGNLEIQFMYIYTVAIWRERHRRCSDTILYVIHTHTHMHTCCTNILTHTRASALVPTNFVSILWPGPISPPESGGKNESGGFCNRCESLFSDHNVINSPESFMRTRNSNFPKRRRRLHK